MLKKVVFFPGWSLGPQGAAGEAVASKLLEAFNAYIMLCSWVTPLWRRGDSFRDLPKSLPALWRLLLYDYYLIEESPPLG